MKSRSVILTFVFLLIPINGQVKDDTNLPPVSMTSGRTLKESFNTQFSRGRCPERFFQLGDECVYISIDGKVFSWQMADQVCQKRVGYILSHSPSLNPNQPNLQPARGVRQLVLNTPEKTMLFEALNRDYNEQNYAVRLPHDYNTLTRCNDGIDDKWPNYCSDVSSSNSTCFETKISELNQVCLREVDCHQRYLRLACEFTLPGSAEIIQSKFRHCTKSHRPGRHLPIWAWIVIAVGGSILVLFIIIGIVMTIAKSRKASSRKQKSLPDPRRSEDKVYRIPPKNKDPAGEPMIDRSSQRVTDDTGYLQPEPLPGVHTSNA